MKARSASNAKVSLPYCQSRWNRQRNVPGDDNAQLDTLALFASHASAGSYVGGDVRANINIRNTTMVIVGGASVSLPRRRAVESDVFIPPSRSTAVPSEIAAASRRARMHQCGPESRRE